MEKKGKNFEEIDNFYRARVAIFGKYLISKNFFFLLI